MERILIEYLANAFWQLPLLAGGAWLLLRLWKPAPATQHRIWLGVLALGLLMPLRGISPATVPPQPAAVVSQPSAYSTGDIAPRMPSMLETNSVAATAQDSFHQANTRAARAGYASLVHRVRLNATAIDCILALWLACALWGVFRLTLAWAAARRLARTARQVVLAGHGAAEVLQCARRLGVNMPDVRESDAIAGPVVVGAIHPVLLWPPDFRRRSDDEFKAALCHEIAHIRRRDYAMNLLCESVALPLRWHPALFGVERRIRATREMACDAVAAEAMESETLYATCLLSLAQSMVGPSAQHLLAAGLFNGNVMEERVMRLMQNNLPTTWRARLVRGMAGAAVMAAVVAVAAAFHVAPAMAQNQPSTPVVPVAPVSPVITVHPVVTPVVRVPAVKPIVNVPTVKPVINLAEVHPVIKVSPVVVHVVPVVKPIIHIAPVAPIIQIAPAPPAKPAAPEKPAQHTESGNHKPVVIFDGQMRDLTPAERARVEQQLEDAQRKIAEATAKIDSPEFRRQIEDAQRKAMQAETMLNSAEFRKQMADAQKQAAEASAKINSPEFKKQIQDAIQASTKVNRAEIQKQMADAQKQIAETTARLNSPEFRQRIEDQVRAAEKVNSAEIQKQMADAQKQVADALARIKAEQKTEAPK